MNTRTFVLAVATALAGLLTFSSSGFAAPGDGGGMAPPDFGDLIILYRDPSGVPYLTADSCWQPLPSDTCDLAACTLVPGVPAGPDVVPVDPATCAVTAECALCTQEADFGRINSARSPDTVFDNQLEDVVFNLATADCVTLDPAGRLVANTVADDGTVSTSTVDSPLQNLAIYRQLILTGSLGAPLPVGAGTLDTAARGLGAASDKTGEVNVDLVAYLNQIMGLSDPATQTILDPKLCIDVKEEVMGTVQLVQKCFLDYGAYTYDRTANFGALPAPPYIPAASPTAGWFEYLAVLDATVPSFQILQGPILEAVFCVDPDPVTGVCVSGVIDPGFLTGNIGGFAQATDDTRAVIDFMHNWPVPGDFPTPVPCSASGVITYDVSISDVSGLQVPVNMVAGTDREFTLTVANAGPDAATGAVLLTARDANGNSIPTFPRTYNFTLASGTPTSWIEGLCVSNPTTITWTATVTAAFDVIPSNNSVTETTVVTGTAAVCGVMLDVVDVVGLTEAAALAALDPQLVPVVNYVNDPAPAGEVIAQVPAACVACADPGDTVTLTVSNGPVVVASDVTIKSLSVPRLAFSGGTYNVSVLVVNAIGTAPSGPGTVTLTGSDGSSFTATFTNIDPGDQQSFPFRWTASTKGSVVWTATVTVSGTVVDTATASSLVI